MELSTKYSSASSSQTSIKAATAPSESNPTILVQAASELNKIRVIDSKVIKALSEKYGRQKLTEDFIDMKEGSRLNRKEKRLFSVFTQNVSLIGSNDNQQAKDMTFMHFYKRDLTPVKESFAICSEKLTYKQNFQKYQGSLMSKGFKDEMMSKLGTGIRCSTSSVQNKKITTFILVKDEPLSKRRHSIPTGVCRKTIGQEQIANVLGNQSIKNQKKESSWGVQLKRRKIMRENAQKCFQNPQFDLNDNDFYTDRDEELVMYQSQEKNPFSSAKQSSQNDLNSEPFQSIFSPQQRKKSTMFKAGTRNIERASEPQPPTYLNLNDHYYAYDTGQNTHYTDAKTGHIIGYQSVPMKSITQQQQMLKTIYQGRKSLNMSKEKNSQANLPRKSKDNSFNMIKEQLPPYKNDIRNVECNFFSQKLSDNAGKEVQNSRPVTYRNKTSNGRRNPQLNVNEYQEEFQYQSNKQDHTLMKISASQFFSKRLLENKAKVKSLKESQNYQKSQLKLLQIHQSLQFQNRKDFSKFKSPPIDFQTKSKWSGCIKQL